MTTTTTPSTVSRPRLSTDFKVFLLVIALLLVGFGAVRFAGAIGLHNDVKSLAQAQVFDVKDAQSKPKEGLVYGLQGVNGLATSTRSTSAKQVDARNFVLTVTGKDGYTSHYDSRTGMYTNGCPDLACWFN